MIEKKVLSALCAGAVFALSAFSQDVSSLIEEAKLKGGLISHIGCGNGETTAKLFKNETFLVHGLDTSEENIEKAREHIKSNGIYGKVSVELYNGEALPYVENLVNMIVCDERNNITDDELLRVLVPNGIAFVKENGKYRKIVKPIRKELDDWSHSMYDSAGGGISQDGIVGPPKHLQWDGAPRWTRFHEAMSTFHTMVSLNGKVFYILDDGPQVNVKLPAQWKLVARDAYNGAKLWERKLGKWVQQRSYKSGPAFVMRLLVAAENKLFTVDELYGHLVVIDATTGKKLYEYPETKGVEEIVYYKGKVFLSVFPNPRDLKKSVKTEFGSKGGNQGAWDSDKKWIYAIDDVSKKIIWKSEHLVVPMTLAAKEDGVCFVDANKAVLLDLETGKEKWVSEEFPMRKVVPVNATPTLVMYKDIVLLNVGNGSPKDEVKIKRKSSDHEWKAFRTMLALSLKDGKKLWDAPIPEHGYQAPKDLLIIDDVVWNGDILGIQHSGEYFGRNVITGESTESFKPADKLSWFHQRCYRSRGTKNYLMPSHSGIEYISPKDGYVSINHWVRGACLTGNIPANGLTYATPHPCACFMSSMLKGLNALAPISNQRKNKDDLPDDQRFFKGTEYDLVQNKPENKEEKAWPVYRQNNQRSGFNANSEIAKEVSVKWELNLTGKLSSITAAENKVFVSQVDKHTINALDAETGKRIWEFTAGGRVDTPPTIWNGIVLFGSADGYIYAVNSTNGKLAWRFRAAATAEKLMSYNQLESVWPVHGSLIVVDGMIYTISGRNMFLDGGIRFLKLNAKTGKKLLEIPMDEINPKTKKSLIFDMKNLRGPSTRSDILSYQDGTIFMKLKKIKLDGTLGEINVEKSALNQAGDDVHLFSPTGFLDDTNFHRNYWIYGRAESGGKSSAHTAGKFTPTGNLLVFDDTSAYAFSRMAHLHGWFGQNPSYHIYSASKKTKNHNPSDAKKRAKIFSATERKLKSRLDIAEGETLDKIRQASMDSACYDYNWGYFDQGMYATAICVGKSNLFVAGPPAISMDKTQKDLDGWYGKNGGVLEILSKKYGKVIQKITLESPPKWDSMIVAYDKIYISLMNGKIICFE